MHKVLIIDDEKDICFLISEILKDENYNTSIALNSDEAISKFNEIKPDLVILDVWLSNSKLDGIEILKEFKSINSNIPIIIISGHGTVDLAVKSIKNGAELVCGGKAKSKTTYECTVIKNPKPNDEINKVEIFGPVLCVYEFKGLEDAIEKANHDLYAFQSSIFTNNLDSAMQSFEKLQAKSDFINEQTAFRVDWMPFGGIKHSGEGVGGIEYTFSDLMYDKLLVINSKKITS